MKQLTIQLTKDISLVISEDLARKLMVLPPKPGKRNKFARLSRIRRNVFREIKALDKEAKRWRYTDFFGGTR